MRIRPPIEQPAAIRTTVSIYAYLVLYASIALWTNERQVPRRTAKARHMIFCTTSAIAVLTVRLV